MRRRGGRARLLLRLVHDLVVGFDDVVRRFGPVSASVARCTTLSFRRAARDLIMGFVQPTGPKLMFNQVQVSEIPPPLSALRIR